MKILISIALGGSFGALSRYYLTLLIARYTGSKFPWATLIVNLLGSFCLGMLFNLFDRITVSHSLRLFLTAGFLGAFTTFSTFTVETLNLFRSGEFRHGLLNLAASNILGVLMALGGFYFAVLIFRK